ncbi:MAG: hypothetical protein WAW96_14840 [Alphaproteobacteria bacterium]
MIERDSKVQDQGILVTLQWWWIPAGLGVIGFLLLFKPAHGPLWPFLLLVPILLISAVFMMLPPVRAGEPTLLSADTIFQILLAMRFACACLMVFLARDRRIAAVPLGLAALFADPILFGYAACALGSPLCM